MSVSYVGWWIKTWYPKLAAALPDEALDELAKLLEAVKKDILKEADEIARREADRAARR